MKKSTLFVFLLSLAFMFAGMNKVSPGQDQSRDDPKEVVLKNLEAFNDHNVPAMLEHIADDFSSYSILPDTTITGIRNKTQFKVTMSGYFENYPHVKSVLTDLNTYGRFVYFKEKATWGSKGKHSQSSFGIYEIKDGKIQRAWYFQ